VSAIVKSARHGGGQQDNLDQYKYSRHSKDPRHERVHLLLDGFHLHPLVYNQKFAIHGCVFDPVNALG